jgi:MoaA/NifB/PqqE/SkfB family radical SAM enzyme
MSRLALTTGIAPRALGRTLAHRGLTGAAWHAARRLGAVAGAAFVGPEVVQITPVTSACNHACPMCWLQHADPAELRAMRQGEKQQRLSLSEWERLFDAMLPGLREVVIVGGGEPLIHPEAIDVCAAVKRRGWRGTLVTNGTLLDFEMAERLVAMSWDTVRVSVHAGDRRTYEVVQGVDRFEELQRNLAMFDRLRRREAAPPTSRLVVYHVLQPANVASVESLVDLATEVGADEVVFEVVAPLDAAMQLDAGAIDRVMAELARAARRSAIPVVLPRSPSPGVVPAAAPAMSPPSDADAPEGPSPLAGDPPGRRCVIGFEQTFVDGFGWVRPCCYSTEKLGNVRADSFADVWRGAGYAGFRRRLVDGRFADYCRGCTLATVLPY